MRARVSWRWVLIGAIAVIGGYWLGVRSLFAAGVEGAWIPYAGHLLGAIAGGALMTAHAPLRPWREPLAAGLLAVGLLALIVLALPHALFGWVVKRAEHPWLTGLLIAALSGLAAAGAAAFVRRFAGITTSAAALLGLSALVISGSIVTISHVVIGLGSSNFDDSRVGLAALAGVFVGGLLTQWLVAARRPWLCGGGTALWIIVFAAQDPSTGKLLRAAFGSAVLVILGALGAMLAWRLSGRSDDALTPTALPDARLR